VRLRRGNFEAEISFKSQNVNLVRPNFDKPFRYFLEIERWIATENPKEDKVVADDPNEGTFANLGSTLDSISATFREFIDENLKSAFAAFASIGLQTEKMKSGYDVLSCKVAYMTLLLALESKHKGFRKSKAIRFFRTIFAGRLALAMQKYFEGIMPPKEIRSTALSAAATETAQCEASVSQVKDNFISDAEYPLDPIYKLIEKEMPLAQKGGASDREKFYKDIFVEMAKDAQRSISLLP